MLVVYVYVLVVAFSRCNSRSVEHCQPVCHSLELFLCALQAAWAANDYSVQDTLDHEVYKMIGRHGSSMVSRGIVAAGSLHATGVAGKCALAS